MEVLGEKEIGEDEFIKLSSDGFDIYMLKNPCVYTEQEKIEKEKFVNMMRNAYNMEANPKRELLLKEETLSSKGATFILKNNTDNEYWYGPDYYIEIKKDGQWVEIQLEQPLVWNSIAYKLNASEEKEINIDWSIGYGELSKGQYRLVKKAVKEEDKSFDDSKFVYLYAEFEIE